MDERATKDLQPKPAAAQGEDASAVEAAFDEDALDQEGHPLAEKAGKVALSVLAATSLTAALAEPPRTDLMTVPEPTPIVMVLDEAEDEVPEDQTEEQDEDENQRLRRILRLLRMLLIALLITAAIVFGALKGCASCTATVLTPDEQEQPEQAEEEPQEQDQAA